MGKGNLILGTGRGKLGDAIFYRTGGEQRFRVRVKPNNPQTYAQLVQRVIVSTAVKAYSELVSVCDHAFQNYEGKLKNHQRFMKLNIRYMRGIGLKNILSFSPIQWNRINYLNWVGKDSDINVVNPYIVSEGDLNNVLFDIKYNNEEVAYPILGGSNRPAFQDVTYRQFAEWLGVNVGDQLTFIWQLAFDGDTAEVMTTFFSRIVLMPSVGSADDKMFANVVNNTFPIAEPNKENYGNLVITTSNFPGGDGGVNECVVLPFAKTDSRINQIKSFAVIVSRFDNGTWRRSSTKMVVDPNFAYTNTMEAAVKSYLKDQTSSLYLNQATTDIPISEDTLNMSEIDDSQELTAYEKNSRKRGKKSE